MTAKEFHDQKANNKDGKKLLYLEVCLVEDLTDSWVIDSEATNLVCTSLQGFDETKSLENGVCFRIGDGRLVLTKEVGNVCLFFDSYRFILLKDAFYVLNFKRNLVSVACLIKYSYSISFGKTTMIRKNNTFVCSGNLHSNLYFLKRITYTLHNTELNNSNQRAKTSNSNESYL